MRLISGLTAIRKLLLQLAFKLQLNLNSKFIKLYQGNSVAMPISQKDIAMFGGVWTGVEMPRIASPDEPHLFDLPPSESPLLATRTAAPGLRYGVRRLVLPQSVAPDPQSVPHTATAWASTAYRAPAPSTAAPQTPPCAAPVSAAPRPTSTVQAALAHTSPRIPSPAAPSSASRAPAAALSPAAPSAAQATPVPPSTSGAPPAAPARYGNQFETPITHDGNRGSYRSRRVFRTETYFYDDKFSPMHQSAPPTVPLVDLSPLPTPRSAPVGFQGTPCTRHFQFPRRENPDRKIPSREFPEREEEKKSVNRGRKTTRKQMYKGVESPATSFKEMTNNDRSSAVKENDVRSEQKDFKTPTQLKTPPPPYEARDLSPHQLRQLRRSRCCGTLEENGHQLLSLNNDFTDEMVKSPVARKNETPPLLSRPRWEYGAKLPAIRRGQNNSAIDETVMELSFPRKTSAQKDSLTLLQSNKLPPILKK